MGKCPCSLPTPIKAVFASYRTVVNNIDEHASTKILQPEWKTGFKTPKKSAGFLISISGIAKEPQLNAERATVATQLGPFCNPARALSESFLAPNRCQ